MHPDSQACIDEALELRKAIDEGVIEDAFALSYAPVIIILMRQNFAVWCSGCDSSFDAVSPDPDDHSCGHRPCDFFTPDHRYMTYATSELLKTTWGLFLKKVGETPVLRSSVLAWLSQHITVDEMIEEASYKIRDILQKKHKTPLNPDFPPPHPFTLLRD